jgi:hypothetical protein
MMTVTKALAYYGKVIVGAEVGFVVQAPGEYEFVFPA